MYTCSQFEVCFAVDKNEDDSFVAIQPLFLLDYLSLLGHFSLWQYPAPACFLSESSSAIIQHASSNAKTPFFFFQKNVTPNCYANRPPRGQHIIQTAAPNSLSTPLSYPMHIQKGPTPNPRIPLINATSPSPSTSPSLVCRTKNKKDLISAPAPSRRNPIGTPWARGLSGARATGDILHKADVIEFRQVAVFLQIGSFMWGHAGEEAFDEVVRDEGVAEVELGDVGLLLWLVSFSGRWIVCRESMTNEKGY